MTVSTTSARDTLALSHAVADHLAAAELHFLTVDGGVRLDLDPQVGIAETQSITRGRTEHLGVGAAFDTAHDSGPMMRP